MSDPRPGGGSVLDVIATYLRELGVKRVYGLPGEDHMGLLHSVNTAGLDYILARDEGAAVMMAACEAEASGLPGVALVTFAPGLTNAINGLAHAYLDRVPLLLLTGVHQRDREPLIVRQRLNGAQLVSEVVKWSAVATTRIEQILTKAIDIALAAPRGPVYLEIPDELGKASAAQDGHEWALPQGVLPGAPASRVRGLDLSPSGRELVERAERPCIIIGAGAAAQAEPFGSEVERFAAEHRCPILCTPAAKGVVPDDHPWYAGTFIGGRLEWKLLARADLVIAFDLEARDIFNGEWPGSVPIISIESVRLSQDLYPVVEVVAGPLIAGLNAVAAARLQTSSRWSENDVRRHRIEVREALVRGAEGLFNVPRAVVALGDVIPRTTATAVDAGFSKQVIAHLWPVYGPHAYFSAHGLSTMGFSIPAVNAAKICDRRRPAIGFMGDGSFLMRATEIGIAANLGLNPIYVVFVDNSLGQIELKQRREGLATVGVRLPPTAYLELARSLGADGAEADSVPGVCAALRDALDSDTPYVIAAHVDSGENIEIFEAVRDGAA